MWEGRRGLCDCRCGGWLQSQSTQVPTSAGAEQLIDMEDLLVERVHGVERVGVLKRLHLGRELGRVVCA